jgi:hypothetical protein
MTLSDGDTVIHHRANVCVNHHDREGKNLCVHCGRWFCDACMSATHKYLCRQCALSALEAKREWDKKPPRSPNRAALPLVFAGLGLAALALSRLGIGTIALPLIFFLLVKHFFKKRRDVFKPGRKEKSLHKKTVPVSARITGEQLGALLRIGNGSVTAAKLANAADVGIDIAKKFLDKQVIEGVLYVEATEKELVYRSVADMH